MRLVKLAVERFQCIESAELELGPHLNVLYGPNDLGKSSLAWAIRAVLLLQHGSSHAERFASWYDAGEPRVALTLCDDSGRYWRVTKVFGGSAGRSTLESSKDGKTFTAEASAREVDKKLRELLRWGLAAPGGQGRQAFPESFLTQVLLADQSQDSVRKVLFDAKLDKDPDDSGRERLVAALGALAQDPLFKQILDETEGKVDQAFTKTGQKKRGAGSPWVASTERIARLRREQEELDKQAKDSAAVEEKLKLLHGQRDAAAAALADATQGYQVAERRLAARAERDRLQAAAEARRAKLREVVELTGQLERQARAVDELAGAVATAAATATEASAAATAADGEVEALRGKLDTLAHASPDGERRLAELQERVRRAEQEVREREAAVASATAAAKAASAAAKQVGEAEAAARTASAAVGRAEAVAVEVAGEVARTEEALELARERQREAKSNDQRQARELRRQALANQVLQLASRRTRLEATLARAQQLGAQHAAIQTADSAVQQARVQLEASRAAVATDLAAQARLEAAQQGLAQVELYGRHRGLREQLTVAVEAGAAAERERRRAVELRQAAAALGAEVKAGLPSTARLAAVRALRDELRVAEAALGGGLSVVVRPKRALTVRATSDGAAAVETTLRAATTVTARRALTLAVDDLLELEITAGEDAARRAAAELRARWLRDGEAVLVEHAVATVEELEAVRARSDDATRRIADQLRDAEIAEQRAAVATGADAAAVREQLAAAEAELGSADREDLAIRLARLGEPWPVGLRKRAAELTAELEAGRGRLELARAAVARHGAQLESLEADGERRRAEATLAQAGLPEPWAVVVATCKAELSTLAGEAADVERQLAGLSTGDAQATEAADAAVASADQAFTVARAAHDDAQRRVQGAAATQVETRTLLEAARATARGLDPTGAWTKALVAERAQLSLTAWQDAVRAAERALVAAHADLVAATAAHAEAVVAREAAVRELRAAIQAADQAAREARARADAAARAQRERIAEHGAAGVAHSELRVTIASVNLDQARRELAALDQQLAALAPEVGELEPDAVAALARTVERQRAALADLDDELAKTRGALEHVGGAIVRERLAELGQAHHRAVERERELELEFAAWRLLQATLRDTESSESAHLGRALAGPVSARFRQLTGGRYGELDLGAQLEAGGIHVAGELRELDALSAGTQDQLATLLRVCIAQQLHSAIVLDDHLSQSDATRVAWFNQMLREAAAQVQIVLITCRPGEVLSAAELAAVAATTSPASALVHAVDLARAIRRFPAAGGPAARSGGKAP